MGESSDKMERLGSSAGFIEALYQRYIDNPNNVSEDWQDYFRGLENGAGKLVTSASWARSDWPPEPGDDLTTALSPGQPAVAERKEGKVESKDVRSATLDSIRALMMIRAYRVRGHLLANLDPLNLGEPEPHPELDPESYGFGSQDMDRPVFIDNVLGLEQATIREIVDILRRTYCSTFAVEFMHINDPDIKAWIQERIEGREKEIQFTNEGKLAILQKLIEAEKFEQFLGKKYTATKRFGLEGGEAMIPALEAVIKTGGQLGVREIVLGMPHRGRLNVLVNVLKKPFKAMFHEFQGGTAHPEDVQGSGDVKYHLGTSADREFDGNSVHLSLTANPSHLEAVDPVVLGKARAKQTQLGDTKRRQVLSLLLHGDAAFAGQGLVAECFMLSGLRGYHTGGTVHFIVNNQIGFTTSPHHSRSSPHPSDIAKMVQAPIFHVNGDDPEAVVFATKVATEFRQEFGKDVVIDMVCYRRFGHNEIDDPSFTQPLMYDAVRNHTSTCDLYAERLIGEGLITGDDYKQMITDFEELLASDFKEAKNYKPEKADWFEGRWSGLGVADNSDWRSSTGVEMDRLKAVGKALTTYPEGFNIHKTLKRQLDAKTKLFQKDDALLDWAVGEALAFGTLQQDGYGIRLSGQDSIRGTFSQRHAELIDQETGERFRPLSQIEGAPIEVIDSPLSEAAVMGFDYGYSLAEPKTLVMWEAQFGDFANGAQVIIDQFIASAEAKWLRMSGLVLLLPHGYEGQGPEHSSARLERFLQLCAERNMQVANCTTPASYFHILRRQMHRNFRKPLVIMTPKSLLRHKRAVSTLQDMGPDTQFHRVLWDDAEGKPGSTIKLKADKDIRRVILCSGKVYYDLLEHREEAGVNDTYILRLEQLYPFPEAALMDELGRFKGALKIIWCQEEPKNMGAWLFANPFLEDVLGKLKHKVKRPVYAGREASASTAAGTLSSHERQQKELLEAAFKA